MKKEHQKDLRYCQKIRQSECFIEADGLQKKIREKLKNQEIYDAEKKMREIDCFWKKDWEYNMTHHTYIEPKVTTPQVFIESPLHSQPMLNRYYSILQKFITKLKIEHEDETTYRIDLQNYPYNFGKDITLTRDSEKTAAHSVEHLLRVFSHVNGQMKHSLQQQKKKAGQLMLEQNDSTTEVYMEFFHNVCDKLIECKPGEEFYDRKTETVKFTSFVIDTIMEAKQKSMFSSVVSVQPFLGELTYLLHPMCFALYGLFSHEILIRQAKTLRGKSYEEEIENPLILDYLSLSFPFNSFLKIKDNFMVDQYRHSKLIFLNLDGYESEFTLEFLRQYHKHIMYVSFPKFSSSSQDEAYNKRFHKKIMFNYSKPQAELFEWEVGPDTLTFQKEQFLENPQNYYKIIESLYANEDAESVPDFNENMYVFPIRMDNLRSNKEPAEENKNIEPYESSFIRFLMRDHLYSEMLKFKAQTIIISYSGKISIENEHFTEIMQQLTKICSKIIFFPNFTTALIKEQMIDYYDNYETMSAYDKVHTDIGRHILTSHTHPSLLEQRLSNFYELAESNPWEVDLMDKLSIVLKVTSGNYNLNRSYQEESLQGKYRNCQIFPYLIHLFDALKPEYEHCKKRVQRESLEAALEIMQRSIGTFHKELESSVPGYYIRVFREIDKLIKDRKKCFEEQRQIYEEYQLLVMELEDKVVCETSHSNLLIQQWQQFRVEECLSLSNAKYHEFSYLQFPTQSSQEEYQNTKSEKMDNLQSLYTLSFCLREHNNQIIKIFKETTLHYQTSQSFKGHKQDFCLILTNVLNISEDYYEIYAARPKLGKKEQRCFVKPVVFRGQEGVIEKKKFKEWTEWNYAQTQRFMILYWPQEFDFIAYYLHKMINKKYEAILRPQIYVCDKIRDFSPKSQNAVFHLLNFPQGLEVIPRWGCSAFFLGDQIFIFGGFHDREKSYLELQNEISTLDLTDFRPDSYQLRKLFNLRKEIYCGEAFNGHLRQHRIPSSFVRPRMQFQFYDYDDLQSPQQKEKMLQQDRENIKKIIMIGGYGQNFKTPHSLFVNYYYQLQFNTIQRRLLSVKKKLVYGKVLPVNIKAMIKNRGVFNNNNLLIQDESPEDKGRKVKEGITKNSHYFAHKIVYAIDKGVLSAKIKNLYALQLYSICKKNVSKFAEMLGGSMKIQSDPDPLSILRLEGDNHHLLVNFRERHYLYSLYLSQGEQEVPLTNKSVISIDTKKQTVYTLLSHPVYTKDRTVLAVNSLPQLQPSLHANNEHLALVLKQVHIFQKKTNLHRLIVCNVNELIVLQGIALEGNAVPEYFLKIKSKNDLRREEVMPTCLPVEKVHSIHTFFFRKNNIITGINFVRLEGNLDEIAMVRQELDLQNFGVGWKEVSAVSPLTLVYNRERLRPSSFELRVEGTNPDSLTLKVSTSQSKYSKLSYIVVLDKITAELQEVSVQFLDGVLEKMLNQKTLLPSTLKTQDKYEDYEYFG